MPTERKHIVATPLDLKELEGIACPAPRAWRTVADLRNAGFTPVRGGVGQAAAASRVRRLSQQLTAARKKAGLSQAQLALRIGTTPAAVARMEKEDPGHVKLETLRRLARVLGAELLVSFVNGR